MTYSSETAGSIRRLAALSLLVMILPTSRAEAQVEKKVLMIGIDGAGGRYVRNASTPSLDALIDNGSGRFDFFNEGALTMDPPEAYGASGVNWSTFLTGVSAAKHNVVNNQFTGADFTNHPHFFQHVKGFDPSLSTYSLANWTPINAFITPDTFADVEIGYDSGSLYSQDVGVKNDAVQFLNNADPDVLFLHFDQVDGAGHTFSWGSPQHTAAIETVDDLVGEVMSALNDRPGVVAGTEDWLVLVSADHGAAPGAFGHVASQGPPNWEVPFIVSGPSVQANAPLRQGTLRDLAATALWHLGIDPYLAGLDGEVRGLVGQSASGVEGDLNGDGALGGDGLGPASSDDVTTFIENWLVEGDGSVTDRYARGDVNIDGVTNLADWALLNNLNPSLGRRISLALSGTHVPEPSGVSLTVLLLALSAGYRISTRQR